MNSESDLCSILEPFHPFLSRRSREARRRTANPESTIQNFRVLHQLLAPSFPVSSLRFQLFLHPPILKILLSCLKFTQNSKSSIQNFPSSFLLHLFLHLLLFGE